MPEGTTKFDVREPVELMKTNYFLLLPVVLLSFNSAESQLCSGSLGDPVVMITFGSGSNPGPSLSAATTFYTYVATDCPADGGYTVRNSTSNCFNNTWHNLTEDHTPNDVNGYFMLVNASFQPGDFYLDTVRGLCASTTYQFAAWIMNVLQPYACSGNGIQPNLTFKIESTSGNVLATYNTGNIPATTNALWTQYGLFFKTPANTSTVVVRITNNAPGGCGNDLALDDISFRPCGPRVTATLALNGDTTVNVCEGDTSSILLNATYSSGYNNPVFQWQLSTDNGTTWNDIPGETQTSFLRVPTGTGQYFYRLTVAENGNIGLKNCRVASNLVSVYVNPLPVVQLDPQTLGCLGSNVTLSASGASNYQWNGPNGFSANTSQIALQNLQFGDSGIYRVKATTDKGCSVTAFTDLAVNPVPVASVQGNNNICEGDSTALQAFGGTIYVWIPTAGLSSNASSNPFASPKDTTTYKVFVYNNYGCRDSATITINVWKKPVANAGPDKKTHEGVPVTLEGKVSGTDISFSWTPPSFLDHPDQLHPVATITEDMTYTLTVMSNKGCGISTDQVFVKVYKKVMIPNAFSPNGDGINDNWMIRGLSSYPDADLRVFNRYGQEVYHSISYNNPWDGRFKGKPIPVGTYYYVIDLKIGEPILNGWVFVIR